LSCVPLSELHFPVPFFFIVSPFFSRCKHPRTSAIRQHMVHCSMSIFYIWLCFSILPACGYPTDCWTFHDSQCLEQTRWSKPQCCLISRRIKMDAGIDAVSSLHVTGLETICGSLVGQLHVCPAFVSIPRKHQPPPYSCVWNWDVSENSIIIGFIAQIVLSRTGSTLTVFAHKCLSQKKMFGSRCCLYTHVYKYKFVDTMHGVSFCKTVFVFGRPAWS
jgi:hypothetical protein